MQSRVVDILAATEGVVAHQVNARGVMGAGLALAVRNRFPEAYSDYAARFSSHGLRLGDTVFTEVSDLLWIASIVGQDGFGREAGKRYTDYAALESGLRDCHRLSLALGIPLYVPHGIGCGLGGGEWADVLEMMGRACPNAIICRLG